MFTFAPYPLLVLVIPRFINKNYVGPIYGQNASYYLIIVIVIVIVIISIDMLGMTFFIKGVMKSNTGMLWTSLHVYNI